MLSKYQIAKAWALSHGHWTNDEDDRRKVHEVVVDFTKETIDCEIKALQTALNDTNQLMSVLLADPLVHKDQKDFIKKRLELNKTILQREGETAYAKS